MKGRNIYLIADCHYSFDSHVTMLLLSRDAIAFLNCYSKCVVCSLYAVFCVSELLIGFGSLRYLGRPELTKNI